MNTEHYTTITVDEYLHLSNTILALREKLQKTRELLEKQLVSEALDLVKQESEG